MRVAIISFQTNSDIIGAKYIHSYILENNYESYLILQPDADSSTDIGILNFIQENNIDIVGISLMSHEFFRVSQFAEKFKSKFSNVLLVFGGIHATIAPEDCLSIGDIVIRGEGENTFLELIRCIEQGKDYSNLAGICIKKDDQLLSFPGIIEENIDKFPFPRLLPKNMFVVHQGKVSLFDNRLLRIYSRYSGIFPSIISTRGCPYSCSYCCNSVYKNLYKNYKLRKRSVESVISECLEEIKQHSNIFFLNFQDDCFLIQDNEWIKEFSAQYKTKIGLPFAIKTTPKHITREKITMLKEAGLVWAFMGLQTGSERINKEIYNRNVSNEMFLNATNIIKNADLCTLYDIILDNPYETEEDLLETLKIILKIRKPFLFQLFSLCFYKGTELNKKATKDNLSFEDPRFKSYIKISPSILNQLISLVPTYPNWIIKYLINHRKNRFAKLIIKLFCLINMTIFEPIAMLKLIHRSCNSDIFKTIEVLRYFARTAFVKLFRQVG